MDDKHHLLVEHRVRVLAEAGTRTRTRLPGGHCAPPHLGTSENVKVGTSERSKGVFSKMGFSGRLKWSLLEG